jgi:hypothetical protein
MVSKALFGRFQNISRGLSIFLIKIYQFLENQNTIYKKNGNRFGQNLSRGSAGTLNSGRRYIFIENPKIRSKYVFLIMLKPKNSQNLGDLATFCPANLSHNL